MEDGPADAGWLLERCELVTAAAGPDGGLSTLELAKEVLSILRQQLSAEQLQSRAFELLGFDNFELIQMLLERRSEIVRVSASELTSRQDGLVAMQAEEMYGEGAGGGAFGVQTERQQRAGKLRQKEARRENRRAKHGDQRRGEGDSEGGPDWLEQVGFDASVLRQERPNERPPPAGRQALGTGAGGSQTAAERRETTYQFYDQKQSLPTGTTRVVHKGATGDDKGGGIAHEEVFVPRPEPLPVDEAKLIYISELEDYAQLAFQGTERLNRLQSELFDAAYKTNENMLVCAPTGAGKTNVAMLALLRAVGQSMEMGVLRKSDFKVIYVAPMKALAQEVVEKFQQRLRPLGIKVAECTGDMQLNKREIEETQVIVTTPEKWDVITRKSGEGSLMDQIKLLLIDEIHLLADERGPVIESIVARTLREVEKAQRVIRIVGLSATLPNYKDVGLFLRASENTWYFDNRYRPVPLEMRFLGITEKQRFKQIQAMNFLAYEQCYQSVQKGNQVMIFVHARKDTVRTAETTIESAEKQQTIGVFDCTQDKNYNLFGRDVAKSRNADLRKLFASGFGIHHAGMLRSDRTLTEKLFAAGVIKVLVCTATLAWGVNLPAHTVIIKGTQIYNPERGGNIDISMLDVQQIFGRAGRPQFDTSGEAIMVTTQESMNKYLGMLMSQAPMESQFVSRLADHLNAEIVSGTVSNIKEAAIWMSYTYCYIRMLRNPMVYGITYEDKDNDPLLDRRRRLILEQAAKQLDNNMMVRFDAKTGNLAVCDLGRVASHYYIRHESIDIYNEMLRPSMTDAEIFHVIAHSHEFSNVRVRDEEIKEMEQVREKYCPLEVKGGLAEQTGKVVVLLQAYISNHRFTSFTLISDTNYVSQNAARVTRALFELAMKRGWCTLSDQMLNICKTIDKRIWWFQQPLRQFSNLPLDIVRKLEDKHVTVDAMCEMTAGDIGQIIGHNVGMGDKIKRMVAQIPWLELDVKIQPITRGILRVSLTVTPSFEWSDRMHGSVEPWWIWVEDGENEHIYHSEYLLVHKKQWSTGEEIKLEFTIPVFQPLPPQYYVRASSDRWVGVYITTAVSFQHLILPESHSTNTDLLDLHPLPVSALQDPAYESMYKYTHFNPVQTQIFHTAYNTDQNILLGSPTGSGKTVCAELCVMRMFNAHPGGKCVYVGPLKALTRERLKDWKEKFGRKLGKTVVELTGDFSPDMAALERADIIITTPEKWDGISRSWRKKEYVKKVQLVILDEVHLLGEERGPVLEVIVSRLRFISTHTHSAVRIVGLSTAVANAGDLASWLGIKEEGLFNFRPSVRPVPLEVHIQGFPGKHYCPRMATMNKPTFAAITQHSPNKPVLVFVSSRRQTRLTALDLISYCASDDDPRMFLHMDEQDMANILERITDDALKHTLAFGIGIHHAGLGATDRDTVEELFVNGKIQILVCTSTLAWGVNFPAHLVVIKGTEFFDGKLGRYVDFPVTDVLQMMGRAGRPQFDTSGKAVILVHQPKKNFYRKFLYQPFPVESHLRDAIHNHINAEVATKTIQSIQDAIDYLTWTYFFRRLLVNPSYYHLEDTSNEGVQEYLQNLSESVLGDLEAASCITMSDDFLVAPTTLGLIASYYYLEYTSVGLFEERLEDDHTVQSLAKLLADAHEYDELPVRHNEDQLNAQLAEELPWEVDPLALDDAHTKAYLLLQAHFGRVELPISDYVNDTKSVMDQALRILNAMVDIAADMGHLGNAVGLMQLTQMIIQARFVEQSPLLQLPFVGEVEAEALAAVGVSDLAALRGMPPQRVQDVFWRLNRGWDRRRLQQLHRVVAQLPFLEVQWSVTAGPETVDAAEGIAADTECTMEVTLSNKFRTADNKVYAPKYKKPKKHG
jgi:activating signal cointegrator complex subunit 3